MANGGTVVGAERRAAEGARVTLPRVGFIGLGLMGHGMARNLALKGFPLTVKVNRDRSRLGDILAAGAREASSNAEVARASDVVILCVTGSPQVEEIVFGDAGLVSAARPDLVVVDSSTSEPGSTARIREAFAAKGTTFVDAPLARTPKEAEEGRLNCMVGADPQSYERVKPVLAAFCENVFHVGPPGAGHALKLLNNYMAMTIAASIAEAFAVAARGGVRIDQLFEVVSKGGVNSGLFQMIAGGAVAGDLTRLKFSIANAAKDIGYFQRFAEGLGLSCPIGAAVSESFERALALGLGERMLPSMIEAQEKLNDTAIIPR
jgi:3-hydroxyisobutyrate dehydrogenase-like beta-hydroxyacid dehydrogenase